MVAKTPKNIAVVTATRAEYGLLSHLIQTLHQHPEVNLQLFVTGTHLVPSQGMTVEAIRQSGVPITEEISIFDEQMGTELGNALAVSRATERFAQAFDKHQPDSVVLLGDRFEMLGIASAATLLNIPIAHIHGGEVTTGAMDDAIRHALTKLASLHFVAAEPYRQRVIQMGEIPERVFNVGAMGLDVIQQTQLLSTEQLVESFQAPEWAKPENQNTPKFLMTYHSETWGGRNWESDLGALFTALEQFPQAQIVWTAANADALGEKINQRVQDWEFWQNQKFSSRKNGKKVHFEASLGIKRYLSALKWADAVVGNSSSGIIEAPAFKTPTVNIGQRQQGRLMAESIFQAEPEANAIYQAMQKALSYTPPAESISLYGDGESAKKVTEVLLAQDLQSLLPKPFYDIKKFL
jgi:UDP-hydrolysing UDP-N-acetyl-D-glucosamine 2-epimerase